MLRNKVKPSNTQSARVAIAIMAAGKGTRLKSRHPKVLHEIGGKPILAHVITAAKKVAPARDIFAIIGHEADQVRAAVVGTGIQFVLQAEQRGTGHALMVARDALAPYDQVIVLSGDAPLITPETIQRLSAFHAAEKATMTLLSAELDDPARIRTGDSQECEKRGSASHRGGKRPAPQQKKIREINAGFYAFAVPALYQHISELSQRKPASRVLPHRHGRGLTRGQESGRV